MTETKRRIKELKALLPGIREKVISVALLLAISLAMVASASYAWYTLSFAPEVSQITTTLSSNGSLEVALAGLYDSEDKLIAPGASAVGDSFSEKGTAANLTWGNLINLSNAYGIESLVLRPATLREGSDAFLSSVDYGSDGRYENAALDFGLTSWTEHDGQYSFMVTEKMRYGVRAISSVTFPDGKSGLDEKLEAAEIFLIGAKGNYQRITNDVTYLTMIRNLMNAYIDAVLNDADANCTDYIDGLYAMLDDLYRTVICTMGDSLAAMANAQMSLRSNNYTPYTRATLIQASDAELQANKVDLKNCLPIYRRMDSTIQVDLETMEALVAKREDGSQIFWSDIVGVVGHLIDINSAKINGKTASELKGDILNNGMEMMSSGAEIVVSGGFLYDFELMSGSYMYVNKIGNDKFQLNVHYKMNMTINATFHTVLYDTKPPALYKADEATTRAMADEDDREFTGSMVAGDTYGMVIDLWVRTNAANTFLMLDGLAEVETYYERVVHKVLDGNELKSYDGWLYTYYNGETTEIAGQTSKVQRTQKVYQIPEDLDGDGVIAEYTIKATETGEEYTVYEGYFYNATTSNLIFRIDNGTITEEPITYQDVYPALEEHQRVVGFSSSNRVDDNYSNLAEAGTMSATQGSGSCYIFYANPENAAATLELLSHMRFAFFSADGTKLAIAKLDTENTFADGGKYIVPMVLIESKYTTPEGEMCITGLVQNEATLISTVVYLDGQELENSMVMAADSVRSSMNLQFASSVDLKSLKNEDLSLQSIALNAALSGGTSFEYTGSAHTNQLTAYIAGLSPTKVEAIFQRRVNANQGSQMEPVPLTFNDDQGAWTGTPSFTMPGTYVLSSLWVDGVEYALPTTLTVTVSGLNVTSVTFPTTGSAMVMTADNSVSRGITVKINADENTRPSDVTARFESEEGRIVTASLSYNATYDYWEGDARFHSSGMYTLTSLMMDGSYFEVDSGLQKSITVYLGLQAQIRLIREEGLTFKYQGGTEEIEIMAEILTDNDESLQNLSGVVLTYGKQGSSNPENGLEAELHWDSAKGCYYDKFEVKSVGTFNFTKITANGNVITVASAAPTIRSQSMEPPKYNGYGLYLQSGTSISTSVNDALMILTDDVTAGYYGAQIANASGANSVSAVLVHSNNTEYIVSGELKTIADTEVYVFAIPNTIANNKNGHWKVKEIRVDGVYSGESYYGSDDENAVADYYTLHLTDEFDIVDKFDVTADTVTFGNQKDTEFMTLHNLADDFGFTIANPGADLAGLGLSISDVKLTLTHNGNSVSYGGYSYDSNQANALASYAYTLTKDAEGKWVIPADATVRLAGSYDYELTFTLTGENVDITYTRTGEDIIKVYSVTPTVQISSAMYSSASSKAPATVQNNSVTVYADLYKTKTVVCNKEIFYNAYNPAEVVITMSGYGEASAATLTFAKTDGGTVFLYEIADGDRKESEAISTYTWSGNGECKRFVGLWESQTGDDDYTVAGEIKAETLVLTFGGVSYTVDVNITINNPE